MIYKVGNNLILKYALEDSRESIKRGWKSAPGKQAPQAKITLYGK